MRFKFVLQFLPSHTLFLRMPILYFLMLIKRKQGIQLLFLHIYEQASGQCINLDKSKIIEMFQLSVQISQPCLQGHGKYLGLPSLVGRSKCQVFQFVKDCIWKQFKGQKEKVLSKARRQVLIKSIVQWIPTFIISCFKIPTTLCHKIERMTVRFFQGNWRVKISIG